MAEWPLEGQEPEDWAGPGDADNDAIEGTVVPFPGKPAPPQPRPRHVPGQPGEVRDVIPEHLRTWAGIKKAIAWRYRRWRKIGLFHLVRTPKMLPLACVWAVVGLARLEMAFGAWAFVTEQAYLRGQTIEAGDIRTYLQVHKEGKETRLFRVPVMILANALAAVLGVVITVKLPVLWLPAGLIAVPFLAAAGRPDHKPIVESAVVPTAYEMLTLALVIRALAVLGIGR